MNYHDRWELAGALITLTAYLLVFIFVFGVFDWYCPLGIPCDDTVPS